MSFVSPSRFSGPVDSLTLVIASANTLSRLTANALLETEDAVKTQLEDWHEKPQRHEWFAVGGVASQYDDKTRMFHDRSSDDPRRVIPAGMGSSLIKEETDLDGRLETLQGREWLAAGDVASPVRTETKAIPEDNGKDLHRRVLAALVGIATKEENHLEDRSGKPAKHELLTSRGSGSDAPAKMDQFFADIDKILSGKTEQQYNDGSLG